MNSKTMLDTCIADSLGNSSLLSFYLDLERAGANKNHYILR